MKRGENYSLARPPRIIYGDKEEQKESFTIQQSHCDACKVVKLKLYEYLEKAFFQKNNSILRWSGVGGAGH